MKAITDPGSPKASKYTCHRAFRWAVLDRSRVSVTCQTHALTTTAEIISGIGSEKHFKPIPTGELRGLSLPFHSNMFSAILRIIINHFKYGWAKEGINLEADLQIFCRAYLLYCKNACITLSLPWGWFPTLITIAFAFSWVPPYRTPIHWTPSQKVGLPIRDRTAMMHSCGPLLSIWKPSDLLGSSRWNLHPRDTWAFLWCPSSRMNRSLSWI